MPSRPKYSSEAALGSQRFDAPSSQMSGSLFAWRNQIAKDG